MTHSLSGDSWCNDLGLAFAELYLFVRGAQMQQCGIAPFDHRVTQLQIPPDLYWIDHTSHFSRCCKGILDPIDYSCANKDVCPFAVTSFGVVWSSDTHFLSPLVTQTSTVSLDGTIKLQVLFRAASQVRTAQHCAFACFHNCSWVWFDTRQFISLAFFSC